VPKKKLPNGSGPYWRQCYRAGLDFGQRHSGSHSDVVKNHCRKIGYKNTDAFMTGYYLGCMIRKTPIPHR
jgi:hypothetical protein